MQVTVYIEGKDHTWCHGKFQFYNVPRVGEFVSFAFTNDYEDDPGPLTLEVKRVDHFAGKTGIDLTFEVVFAIDDSQETLEWLGDYGFELGITIDMRRKKGDGVLSDRQQLVANTICLLRGAPLADKCAQVSALEIGIRGIKYIIFLSSVCGNLTAGEIARALSSADGIRQLPRRKGVGVSTLHIIQAWING